MLRISLGLVALVLLDWLVAYEICKSGDYADELERKAQREMEEREEQLASNPDKAR